MSELPEGLHEFLSSAGWGDAEIDPIPGDASFRRYFRLRNTAGAPAMLMHAPPPHEDPAPFLLVAQWLSGKGMRAPEIIARNPRDGWVLTEDFGNDRMRDWLDENPDAETSAYEGAIDALVELHRHEPGPFSPYDMAPYQREAALLTESYAPTMGLNVDVAGYEAAWAEALEPLLGRQHPGVTVLRDYHAENIMLLGDPRTGAPQGLIDFQDALVVSPAYDMVSLLEDVRRDVAPDLIETMILRYLAARPDLDAAAFRTAFAILGGQRNAKIVGIFTRLWKRDGKAAYLDLIPRGWRLLTHDLAQPALAPVRACADRWIPPELRRAPPP